MQKKFKIAFIGAGSIGFTRGLLADLLSVPEFSGNPAVFCAENGIYKQSCGKLQRCTGE